MSFQQTQSFFNAVKAGNLIVVKFLLSKNPKLIYQTDTNHRSALVYASKYDHLDIVEFLISSGININARDSEDKTALMEAVESNNKDIVIFLLFKKADISAMDGYGLSSLMYAPNRDIAEILIANGADVNARSKPKSRTVPSGMTPLMFASAGGRLDLARFLITKGADVNVKDSEGDTALAHSMKSGHHNIAHLLRQYGAKE